MDFMNQHLSPEEEDQMEEMMMLLQMDNIPDFAGFHDESPILDHRSNIDYNSAVIFPDQRQPRRSGEHSRRKDDGEGSDMAAMREMIFRIAAMQPVHIDPESVKPPKRKNVKISTDPQSVAARHRRERISERIRILQRLVPGGTKMDTASMLDEAIHYVKFLKNQVQSLECVAADSPQPEMGIGFSVAMSAGNFNHFAGDGKGFHR